MASIVMPILMRKPLTKSYKKARRHYLKFRRAHDFPPCLIWGHKEASSYVIFSKHKKDGGFGFGQHRIHSLLHQHRHLEEVEAKDGASLLLRSDGQQWPKDEVHRKVLQSATYKLSTLNSIYMQ